MNLEKVNNAAARIQKLITVSVKEGKWGRSSIGEQPTRENIEKSIGWAYLGIYDKDEAKAVMDIVYPKLRKNGILAKLRGEEPAHMSSRLAEDASGEEEEEEG